MKRRIPLTRTGYRSGRSTLDYGDAEGYLLSGVGRLDRHERAVVTVLAVDVLENML